MKTVLLDKSKNYYKANMHCHSKYSDGKETVDELKSAYMAKGYSIIAFSDHEHLVDNSRLSDENFLAITSCEIAIKQFKELSTLKQREMKVCHLNLYSMDPHNIKTPCYSRVYDHFTNKDTENKIIVPDEDFEREYSHEGISEIIKKASDDGFLVSYNHSRWSLENATDYLGYKGLWGVEIFNTASWRSGFFDYNINVYDDLLREGNRVGCIAGDDNHTPDQLFGGYTMINAESLDYGTIMSALKNMNFYTSTGPGINGLYVEENRAHLSVDNGEYAVMTTGVRHTKVKKLSAVKNPDDIIFELTPDMRYIRFDVVDEKGRRANTCAYFL